MSHLSINLSWANLTHFGSKPYTPEPVNSLKSAGGIDTTSRGDRFDDKLGQIGRK